MEKGSDKINGLKKDFKARVGGKYYLIFIHIVLACGVNYLVHMCVKRGLQPLHLVLKSAKIASFLSVLISNLKLCSNIAEKL